MTTQAYPRTIAIPRVDQSGRPTVEEAGRSQRQYRTELAQGGHIEVVVTPGLPTVALICNASGTCSAVDLTEAEIFDVCRNLSRKA